MGGHGHEPPYKVPDHTIYQVKGIKQLELLERKLAEVGLKDPWIRNEAWRFNPAYGTKFSRFRAVMFRGFIVGVGLTALTIAYDKTIGGKDDHGHGEHH